MIPGLGRSPGEGNDNPLQYSSLENPMDREAWWGHKERPQKGKEGYFRLNACPPPNSYAAVAAKSLQSRAALSLGGEAPAWECSLGRFLSLGKSSPRGRLWQCTHPQPLSPLQGRLAPRSEGCDPVDCSPPGSMGILQARILEWVAMPSSRFINVNIF